MMHFLNKKHFWHTIVAKYPVYVSSVWFTGALLRTAGYHYYSVDLPNSLSSLSTSVGYTLGTIRAHYPLILFPDKMCGWKDVPMNRTYSPVQVESEDELCAAIRQMYIRTRKGIENYYITDTLLEWFIIIDHEKHLSFCGKHQLADAVYIDWQRECARSGAAWN